MKKLLLALALLFTIHSFSQEYIPMLQDGNKWGGVFCEFGDCSAISITEIEGEEIVNGQTYKILNNNSCLAREENGIVYVLNDDNTEDILLDFTLDIGASFFPQGIQDNCLNNLVASPTDEFRVVDIQTIEILGEDRKVIFMEYYENGNPSGVSGEEEIWIEGIGSTAAIGPQGFVLDFEVQIKCFSNDTGTVRFNGNEISNNTAACEATTAGVSEFLLNQIKITPNPVSETTTLSIPQEISAASIVIFDVNGKTLMEQHISEENTTIDFSSLQSGMYFYQIYSENERIVTKKLIVK